MTLSDYQRDMMRDFIAMRYLDSMSGRDLERYFFDTQVECLAEYTDDELLGALEDVSTDKEFAEFTQAETLAEV